MSTDHITELRRTLAEVTAWHDADQADELKNLRAENQALRTALVKAEAEGKAFRTAFYDLHTAVNTAVSE